MKFEEMIVEMKKGSKKKYESTPFCERLKMLDGILHYFDEYKGWIPAEITKYMLGAVWKEVKEPVSFTELLDRVNDYEYTEFKMSYLGKPDDEVHTLDTFLRKITRDVLAQKMCNTDTAHMLLEAKFYIEE